MEYKCGICGEHMGRDLLVYINHTQQHIINEIQSKHPDWIEKNGVCNKCLEYYRGQMQGKPSQDNEA